MGARSHCTLGSFRLASQFPSYLLERDVYLLPFDRATAVFRPKFNGRRSSIIGDVAGVLPRLPNSPSFLPTTIFRSFPPNSLPCFRRLPLVPSSTPSLQKRLYLLESGFNRTFIRAFPVAVNGVQFRRYVLPFFFLGQGQADPRSIRSTPKRTVRCLSGVPPIALRESWVAANGSEGDPLRHSLCQRACQPIRSSNVLFKT